MTTTSTAIKGFNCIKGIWKIRFEIKGRSYMFSTGQSNKQLAMRSEMFTQFSKLSKEEFLEWHSAKIESEKSNQFFSIQEAIDGFIETQKSSVIAPKTLFQQSQQISAIGDFLADTDSKFTDRDEALSQFDVHKIDNEFAEAFKVWLKMSKANSQKIIFDSLNKKFNIVKLNSKSKKNKSGKTVNNYLLACSKSWQIMIQKNIVSENPFASYNPRRPELGGIRYFNIKDDRKERGVNDAKPVSLSDEKKILENAPKWLQNILIFAIETGARKKNVLLLKCKQFSEGNMTNNFGVVTFYGSETKNGHTYSVPLSKRAGELLMKLKNEMMNKDGAIRISDDEIAEEYFFNKPSGYSFESYTNKTGYNDNDLDREFSLTLFRAGIQKENPVRSYKESKSRFDRPCIKFHDYGRRTFAHRTIMKNGGSYVGLKELGGWTNLSMPEHYASQIPSDWLQELAHKEYIEPTQVVNA